MTTDVALEAPDLGESALVYNLPLDSVEMSAWIDNASHGDRVVYFLGHLSVARDPILRPFGKTMAEKIDEVGRVVMDACEDGMVIATQRRIADGCFAYVARRTRH